MKYLFILGRNPELSIAEIFSYFEKEKNRIINYEKDKYSLLLDLEEVVEAGITQSLGGTIAVGKVMAEGEFGEISKQLDTQEIYYGTSNKMNYCIWNFSHDNTYNKIAEYLKKRFREERLKAVEKNLNGFMELQEGGRVKISKSRTDEEYFVFGKTFGKIIEKTDYKKIEERDMTKPERREKLAISPRLAKIMINLSQVKEGETLTDPFCGVGVILTEALLQKIKVVGIDIDSDAINGAIQNLGWAHFKKEDYKLRVDNSRDCSIDETDVLVTEPDLGETLKKMVQENVAKKMLYKFELLMISVLNNLKNKVRGRIVFSSPYILLNTKKRVGCNIEKILYETGLKLVKGPLAEYRKDKVVSREIFVLQKS